MVALEKDENGGVGPHSQGRAPPPPAGLEPTGHSPSRSSCMHVQLNCHYNHLFTYQTPQLEGTCGLRVSVERWRKPAPAAQRRPEPPRVQSGRCKPFQHLVVPLQPSSVVLQRLPPPPPRSKDRGWCAGRMPTLRSMTLLSILESSRRRSVVAPRNVLCLTPNQLDAHALAAALPNRTPHLHTYPLHPSQLLVALRRRRTC